MNRFHWLDLVRFLAALTVLLVHARGTVFVEFGALPAHQRTFSVALIYAFTRIGNEAVIMFFVLSGFLVGGKAIERISDGSFQPLDYTIDRFTRIMLPLFPALILTAVVELILGNHFSLSNFLGNLLSLQGIWAQSLGSNAPLWSLPYEVWLYVLCGSIGVAIFNRQLYFLTLFFFVLIFTIFTRLSSVYLFCWVIGAFAYTLRPRSFSSAYFITGAAVSFWGVLGTQLGSDSVSLSLEFFRIFVPTRDLSILLTAVGISVLISQAAISKPKSAFGTNIDFLGTKLAAFSYTLYLTHYPLLQTMKHFGIKRAPQITLTSVLIYLFAITACQIIAYILYYPFEKQTSSARRLIRNWITSRLN